MHHVDLFFLKLTVAPVMMLFVSLAANKWGSFAGGVLSGLPLTSAPIILFLSIEQGSAFAQQAASSALSGLAAVLFTYTFYLCITRVVMILPACLFSLVMFVIFSWLSVNFFSPAMAISVCAVLAVTVIWRTANKVSLPLPLLSPPWWDMPLRLFAASTLLLLVTGLARFTGPAWSGIFSPVPVVAWPLTVFIHQRSGRAEMIAAVRGNMFGVAGVIAFYTVVRTGLLSLGLTMTFTLALMAAAMATLVLIKAVALKAR